LSKSGITEVKFSPDGNIIAFGSKDKKIYVYTYPEFEQHDIIRRHSAAIKSIDFSSDGTFI